MSLDGRAEMEDFVRDGADFERDALLTANLHQHWVPWEGVAMAYALRSEKNGIKKVAVGRSIAF